MRHRGHLNKVRVYLERYGPATIHEMRLAISSLTPNMSSILWAAPDVHYLGKRGSSGVYFLSGQEDRARAKLELIRTVEIDESLRCSMVDAEQRWRRGHHYDTQTRLKNGAIIALSNNGPMGAGEIAEYLGIPRIISYQARKFYRVSYHVFDRLMHASLKLVEERDSVKRYRDGRYYVYELTGRPEPYLGRFSIEMAYILFQFLKELSDIHAERVIASLIELTGYSYGALDEYLNHKRGCKWIITEIILHLIHMIPPVVDTRNLARLRKHSYNSDDFHTVGDVEYYHPLLDFGIVVAMNRLDDVSYKADLRLLTSQKTVRLITK